MTEHKYTDEEKILSLLKMSVDVYCNAKLTPEKSKTLLDLINRQKAEVAFWMDAAANAKKEAVKEFAERMKEWMNDLVRIDNGGTYLFFVGEKFIDDLVKEFTEE